MALRYDHCPCWHWEKSNCLVFHWRYSENRFDRNRSRRKLNRNFTPRTKISYHRTGLEHICWQCSQCTRAIICSTVEESKSGRFSATRPRSLPSMVSVRQIKLANDKSTKNADRISGENLDGAELSLTTHSSNCQWERKDTIYQLKVPPSDPHERMSERAFINIKLPYYKSTLYMCLTTPDSNEVFHQGNRYVDRAPGFLADVCVSLSKACIEDSSHDSSNTRVGNDRLFSISPLTLGTFLGFESRSHVIDTPWSRRHSRSWYTERSEVRQENISRT